MAYLYMYYKDDKFIYCQGLLESNTGDGKIMKMEEIEKTFEKLQKEFGKGNYILKVYTLDWKFWFETSHMDSLD